MTRANSSFSNPDHQRTYDEQGFVVVPILTAEEAQVLRAQVEDRIPSIPFINDPQQGMYNSTFDPDFPQCIPAEFDALMNERLGALLDGYRYPGACVLAKIAGAGRLALHQHQPLTPNIYSKILHYWMTLEDVDEGHCALRVVPRSHRILRHVQSFSSPPYFADFKEVLEAEFAVAVPMRAGEALLMDGSLLHGSCPNRSDRAALRVFSAILPEAEPLCILTESEGPTFDAYAVEGKQVDPGLHCMCEGNVEGLEHMGRLDSRNTQLTLAEFEQLLKMDRRIEPGFDPIDVVRATAARSTSDSFWQRVGQRLRSREIA